MTIKLNLLNDLIVQDILLAKAAALKLAVADSEIDTAFANARKNITDEAFQQELTRRGLTSADMREELRRELLAQKVIDQELGPKLAVTDKEVTAFFDANRAQFNLAEDAYHLGANRGDPGPRPPTDQQHRRRCRDTAGGGGQSPDADGAPEGRHLFQELAMGYSEDPDSASRGGDLGFVPVSRLKQAPPPMRDAVLNKKPGTVTVASIGGAHSILLVVAHESAGQRDLSMPAVRERITEMLRGRREQLLRTAYLTAARGDANVVNYLARRLVEPKGEMPSLQPPAPGAK